MTDLPDSTNKNKYGLVASLADIGDGKARLSFDDVERVSDETPIKLEYIETFLHKDYDIEVLENFSFSKHQLADIGQFILSRVIGNYIKKVDRQKLISDIREAFLHAKFPDHMGLISAEAVDDWITDQKILRKLTEQEDFCGSWWDVPESHLSRGSLGLNYLDSIGMAFYLPAFMTLALEKPEYSNISKLVWELNPIYDEDEEELYAHFLEKMAMITGERKKVCIKFLEFAKEALLINGHGAISEIEDINKALHHEFWLNIE